MNTIIPPPESVEQLLQRAESLAGLTLGQLALSLGQTAPQNLRRDKGWPGQLLEMALGANAGSKPQQDFLHLGVELKSIPVDVQGQPLETTYVCVAPLVNITGLRWQQSLVYHKLQQVLWIPVQGDRTLAPADRRIGMPILWRPDAEQQRLLQQDWEEIMELISLGKVSSITARHGEVLQLRPKAANSRTLTESIAADGSLQLTNPRGFYLKTAFTRQILRQYFG
ncbi:MAG: mismatch repair protein MutH [Shewanella sp.]|uniref:DNA mismatch repair endonuclease MutH n=1 Tax=Shewanella fodinae TaxID=552357 RepID=UPI001671BD4E|nr:DNA mismatch repair endonuclease MutH [Shewanella fodinae]MCL2906634.1 DNA mismatch repair endonuclease MutH [Shewanella fodinae]MDN5369236.1 mismatch repair protein MutH [Shewanella sp.]GGZ01513.1 DNA mismatch repair protein MutH [Shewanella fodinae]